MSVPKSTRFAAALFVLALARPAAADDAVGAAAPVEPLRARVAPLAGALTAVVPFSIGCALWAQNGQVHTQDAGTFVMVSGLALAPWVSHGLAGRWRRAAAFGALSAASGAATLGFTLYKDPMQPGYRNVERVPFGVLLTSTLFASMLGVLDSFLLEPTETP